MTLFALLDQVVTHSRRLPVLFEQKDPSFYAYPALDVLISKEGRGFPVLRKLSDGSRYELTFWENLRLNTAFNRIAVFQENKQKSWIKTSALALTYGVDIAMEATLLHDAVFEPHRFLYENGKYTHENGAWFIPFSLQDGTSETRFEIYIPNLKEGGFVQVLKPFTAEIKRSLYALLYYHMYQCENLDLS